MVDFDAVPNGRYDLATLAQVEPGIFLRPEVAAQYRGAIADYTSQTGSPGSSSEGYRPLGAPGDLAAGNGNTQWYWFEMYGSPRAAVPGTSNHGRAAAVDINDWTTYGDSSTDLFQTFSGVMRAYGFVDDVDDEPWHWHYIGSPAVIAPAFRGSRFFLEDDMYNDDDRRLAEATNRGVVDAVVRLYRIENKLDQALTWIGLNKWALTGNETPEAGLRSMVARVLNEVSDDVGEVQRQIDLVNSSLPDVAVEPDLSAIEAPVRRKE
ncbi:M15 family metallopeptidase [Herbiconiux sp. P17]|uniref:M15 family metallopeptidase n=1 Tax=Herbiconiux wuyangfengii TaxID=3342794 RepID=UPI0035B743A2